MSEFINGSSERVQALYEMYKGYIEKKETDASFGTLISISLTHSPLLTFF